MESCACDLMKLTFHALIHSSTAQVVSAWHGDHHCPALSTPSLLRWGRGGHFTKRMD